MGTGLQRKPKELASRILSVLLGMAILCHPIIAFHQALVDSSPKTIASCRTGIAMDYRSGSLEGVKSRGA